MSSPPENRPENDLIARAIEGDSDAFGALYDAYVKQLYTYVYFQVTDHQLAEDLTEITFLRTFERLSEFRTQKQMVNFRAWLHRIARNLVIDHYRTRKPLLELDPEFPLPSPEPSPEAQLQLHEEVARIYRALEQVDGLFKEVIVLRLINGLSYAETATAMDITQNYVRVLQFRALKKLRSILDSEK